ncbi:LysE family translocator [Streptomyces sp. NPDC000594]|uniref:LysE family translocator n=1 Tax=Streptomyces sp. NPDC000594 TaxID=3154261 RepID=UPI00332C34B9
MEWHRVLGFLAAIVPLTLIPGTNFTLVTQKVIAGSRSDGFLVTFGTACGLLVHAAFAAVGLSALVMSSTQALTVVRILGGLYLVWLGVTTWRSAHPRARARTGRRLPWSHLGGFGLGFWSNLTNPRAATVYLTLVPQFLAPDRPIPPQIAVLTLLHAAVLIIWLLTWASVVASARAITEAPWFRRVVSRVAGAVLVALGVRTVAVR